MNPADRLLDRLLEHYRPAEFPALYRQYRDWSVSRPLDGLKVLDATPVFRNTMAKYLALLAGGADLRFAVGRNIPADPAVVDLLPSLGVPMASASELGRGFDAVLDCGGVHAPVPSRLGYVELTRSGMYRYADAAQPVFLADDGRIKVIETGLGTGDGFVRGMAHFGFDDFCGRTVAVIGGGKVGRGIAARSRRAGAQAVIVDDPGKGEVDRFDRRAVAALLARAWCVVTATGLPDSMAAICDPAQLAASPTLLVNMGVEDEYGPAVPAERVLNAKQPLNFVLEEPTLIQYIDPTMALDNAGILELLAGTLQAGLNRPSAILEDAILATVRADGVIAAEIDQLGLDAIRP